MKVTAAAQKPIPRCPPPMQLEPLMMFRKRVNSMSTKDLKALVARLKERAASADSKPRAVLQQKLQIARNELKSRRPDAEYKAKLRKMSDSELRTEYSRAQDALWCATHGIAYIPEQVEAAQHRIRLIQAEAGHRGIRLPIELPFVR